VVQIKVQRLKRVFWARRIGGCTASVDERKRDYVCFHLCHVEERKKDGIKEKKG